MKFLAIMFFLFSSFSIRAHDVYKKYLLAKVYAAKLQPSAKPLQIHDIACFIPRYEIPKGNIFCRMEDKLTRATGIWIKVGVK